MKFINEISEDDKIDSFLNMGHLFEGRLLCSEMLGKNILHDVIYTDDDSLLEPKTVLQNNDSLRIGLEKIGIYKNTYWSFQKEWRYIIHLYPFEFSSNLEEFYKNTNRLIQKIACDHLTNTIDHYDIKISTESFKKMIVTESPKISTGNRILLSLLLENIIPTQP